MKRPRRSRWLGFLILLCSQLLPAADRFGQIKLGLKASDLLDGRLTICLPAEARVEAMQHGIMSAPEANAEQTRVVIDAGRQRMVIMTYERFATGKDFESQVKQEIAKFPRKIEAREWKLGAPLKGYAYFPVTPAVSEEANLVMGLYVVRSDETVQEVRAYVNPDGAKNFAEASSLAKAVLQTVAEGRKALDSTGGDRELFAYSKESVILITLPSGYVATSQRGPDFLVHHIHKVTGLGSPAETIGIYLGDYPETHNDYVKKDSGALFGKSVDWLEKTERDEGQAVIVDDALVSLRSWFWNRDLPSYADVFLSAEDNAAMQELKKIAATFRIGKPKAAH